MTGAPITDPVADMFGPPVYLEDDAHGDGTLEMLDGLEMTDDLEMD